MVLGIRQRHDARQLPLDLIKEVGLDGLAKKLNERAVRVIHRSGLDELRHDRGQLAKDVRWGTAIRYPPILAQSLGDLKFVISVLSRAFLPFPHKALRGVESSTKPYTQTHAHLASAPADVYAGVFVHVYVYFFLNLYLHIYVYLCLDLYLYVYVSVYVRGS